MEIEKVETIKTIKSNKKDYSKNMTAITNDTIRGIVRIANEEDIKKEDIVSLLKENGQFVLVYFK